jgi:hypothetical protein
MFSKETRGSCKTVIVFYPSPEYLDAGKFKLSREMLREKGSDDYSKYYSAKVSGEVNDKATQPPIISLNFGALAIVSGVKSEQAK